MKGKKRPAIILVHGLRGDHHGLLAIARLLESKQYHVLTPDLPGYGKRPALQPQNLDSYADWLAGYIKSQKLDRPIVIGHSMGSIVVSHFVVKYPDLCDDRAIYLAPIFRTWHGQIRSNHCNFLMNLGLHLLPKRARFKFLKSNFISLCVSRFLTYDRSQREYIDDQHLRYSGHFTSAKTLMTDIKISMRNQTILSPSKKTLICIGEFDKLTSNQYAAKLARENKATFVEIAETGHLVNYENPKAIVRSICQFLEA